MPISFNLNGKKVSVDAAGSRMLAYVLRGDLGLTGTKVGCGAGICGACTVLVDGEAARSCSTPLEAVAGREVTTIEGLERSGALHAVQEAFLAHTAFQCGFCTPGMILNACALLRKNPRPTREQIAQAMEGNLCRCGTHGRILDAVQDAAKGGAR
ncbi:(2Fe-2S)-binding protein [Geothrix sp. 21YS21S-2]|uniref:(2Fe-2S)-binding protein n=1 Tax=Geothrix sp. 21YS21S-2 TaxID=3068893 RepID=UPI0027B93FE1|nr:(2Fe-2S)-binding protein [Geothrix sp. 21YS21S-2]